MSKDETSDFTVTNVVAQGQLKELELEEVGKSLGDKAELKNQPRQLDVRLDNSDDGSSPLTKFFESGKYIIVGADSIEDMHREHKRVLDEIREFASEKVVEGAEENLEIVNVVANSRIEGGVNLEALSISLGYDKNEYEPEQFPAVVVYPIDYPCTFLVFSNGKTVATGGTDPEKMKKGFEEFIENDVSKVKELEYWMD